MKTLYDQLKPHIKAALDESHEDYSTSIDYIFSKLQTVNRYSELTIDDVDKETMVLQLLSCLQVK